MKSGGRVLPCRDDLVRLPSSDEEHDTKFKVRDDLLSLRRGGIDLLSCFRLDQVRLRLVQLLLTLDEPVLGALQVVLWDHCSPKGESFNNHAKRHDATDLELHVVDLAAFVAGLDRLADRFLLLRLEGLGNRLHIDLATRRAGDSRLGRLLSFCLQLLHLRFETVDLSARFGSLGLESLVSALRGFELWTWGVSGCASGLDCAAGGLTCFSSSCLASSARVFSAIASAAAAVNSFISRRRLEALSS